MTSVVTGSASIAARDEALGISLQVQITVNVDRGPPARRNQRARIVLLDQRGAGHGVSRAERGSLENRRFDSSPSVVVDDARFAESFPRYGGCSPYTRVGAGERGARHGAERRP